MRGTPASILMFFRGIPLLPPLARISAATCGLCTRDFLTLVKSSSPDEGRFFAVTFAMPVVNG